MTNERLFITENGNVYLYFAGENRDNWVEWKYEVRDKFQHWCTRDGEGLYWWHDANYTTGECFNCKKILEPLYLLAFRFNSGVV